MNKSFAGNCLLILSLVIVLFLGRMYSNRYFIAWPDELFFVEIADSFKSTGVLGIPSTEGNGVNTSGKTYWMPPVYPLSLSVWFWLADSTLINARIFSNIIACVMIVFFYLLARRLCGSAFWAGVCALLLSCDIQFFFTINYARPEILSLTFSMVGMYLYWSYLQAEKNDKRLLFIAWAMCNIAMLAHPVPGSIGCIALLLHLLAVRTRLRLKLKNLIYIGLITLAFISAWYIYILQDVEAFNAQFIQSQLTRKADLVTQPNTTLKALYHILCPIDLHHPRPLHFLYAFLFYGLIYCTVKDRKYPYAPLFVLLAYLVSKALTEFIQEMAYLPLNIPFYYLGLCFIIGTFNKGPLLNLFKLTDKLKMRLNYLWMALTAALLLNSSRHAYTTIRNIRYSAQASTYDPATFASELIAAIPPQKTLGMMIFPDVYDLLDQSGHFKKISHINWIRLDEEGYNNYILKNDYLATTESFLNPSYNTITHWIKFPDAAWFAVANEHYKVERKIQLEGGGVTLLWKKQDISALQKQ